MATTRLRRDEVPDIETWDLSKLIPTDQVFKNELKEIPQAAKKLIKWKGKVIQDAKTLFDVLEAYTNLKIRLIHLDTYASLKLFGDTTNTKNQMDEAQANSVITEAQSVLTFIVDELYSLDETRIQTFIDEEPQLRTYSIYLNRLLDLKPYRLSAETEQTLASLSEVLQAPYSIYKYSKLADMQFQPVIDRDGNEQPVSFALYEGKYEASDDTVLRRNAYDSFTQTLNQYKHTFATIYATEVKKEIALAKLRGYQSATEALLKRQHVTKEMYDNQLDIISQELAPHYRRYARLKQNVLGLDKMTFPDLKAPLSTYNPPISFEESKKSILEALEVMGADYLSIIKQAFDERWIDYADNIGKSTGGFCSSPYGAPSYILLTWTNQIRNMFTLAHELGHCGHFQLSNKHQHLVNTRASMYFIEAPSTLNELILTQHLRKRATTDQMKTWITDQLLGTYYHNFVTHLLEGVYQRKVMNHAEKGNPINADVLTKFKLDTLKDFWGDSVEIMDRDGLTWMRQPHYYMGLYSYTYSAGLTVATVVSQQFEAEGQAAVDRWLSVLKSGGCLSPQELIEKANVDILNPDTIRQAVRYVGSLITEVESYYS
ncbi:oligoendopeptidase F [Terrilactibacillus sp. BCM23-1]|uniref:Oligopeptidase F n=1 Tax=Terrilactibacillus tamarindi TaxID=2599694 RepID=A0A6N8CSD4_9BACI|nr:oligoendopeptidase F [Terrilactibacillus tamarindi]MTT32600.1 oligoendopeptidase F [Terrilactibacillus tamarindi]